MTTPEPPKNAKGFFRRAVAGIGPAIIVACIVLGPGSILTSSKVGCQFGFSMAWLILVAGVLMLAAVATATRIGVHFAQTPLQEISDRLGRPLSFVTGLSVFFIAASFQFGNNLGVLAAIEPLVPISNIGRVICLVILNSLLAVCLFGFKRIYANLESLMMVMMGIMLCGFAANLFFAGPSFSNLAAGLMPSLPDQLSGNFFPTVDIKKSSGSKTVLIDPWLAVQGLIATSFSVAGAFYQAFLVREKGLTKDELSSGFVDSCVGTSVLVIVSLMIMATASTVLMGRVDPGELKSAGDVAIQLEPMFGPAAKWLFCIGILAGAISSFLVNSILGGTFLADGVGKDSSLDSLWTKMFSIGVMAIGMIVALSTTSESRVPLIIFAQAVTVLAVPVLAVALLYLGTRRTEENRMVVPMWLNSINILGLIVVLLFALRTVVRIYFQF
ncbi:MAG: NRAMP family divalent metal transporter [Mariniblastus sp.]